jgi:DNA-binding transcriptional regulator YiaG
MAKGDHWREYDRERFEPGELKRLRQARDLSQEQAARTIGCSATGWARWEGGERIPSPAHSRLILREVDDDQAAVAAHSGQG